MNNKKILIIIFIIFNLVVYYKNKNRISKNIDIKDKYKINLISFASNHFNTRKNKFIKECIQTNWFQSIKIYNPNIISNHFINRYKYILNHKRGGGYWIWKFDIILNNLKKLKDNEYLIYIDIGCEINKKGEKRLIEYLELLNNTNEHPKIIGFQLKQIEKYYTTEEIFKAFQVNGNQNIIETGQILATIQIMKKDDKVIKIFEDCLKLLDKDPDLITDKYNQIQPSYFIDNRHDQSLISVSKKINGCILLEDETYFNNFKSKEALKYPFHAKRKRH